MFDQKWLFTITNEQFVSFFFLFDNSHLSRQVKKTLRDVVRDMGITYVDASHQQIKESLEKTIASMCLKYKKMELRLDGESLFEPLFKEYISTLIQIKLNERQKLRQWESDRKALANFIQDYKPIHPLKKCKQ